MTSAYLRIVAPALLALAGCSHASNSLQARSATQLGCQVPHGLQISGHQPGDPRQNIPERWQVSGCGGEFSCTSFLMSSGEPAHTECLKVERPPAKPRPRKSEAELRALTTRLQQASVQQVAYTTRCSADRMRVTRAQVKGSSHIYTVYACGQTYRCLTQGVGSLVEDHTRCEELVDDE